MATIAHTTVRTIIENPTLTAKAQLALVQKVHPNASSEKCIAWYRVHIKKEAIGKENKLSKGLRELVKDKNQLALDL